MNRWSTWLYAGLVAMLMVSLFPLVAAAQEVVPAPTTIDGPWWAQLLYVILTSLITLFLVPYLARLSSAAKAKADSLRSEGLANGLQARNLLIEEVKAMLLSICANIAERDLPRLAREAVTGNLAAADIKGRLKLLGDSAKQRAIDYFQIQGLDLVELVGDHYLDELVRWAADRVSPFPGKETAVALAVEKYSNLLAEKGVDWMREHWFRIDPPAGVAMAPVPAPAQPLPRTGVNP